ncbi:MAG TPA: hypothetical protein VLA33_00160 [Gemmatimonadota bacterium]|nr:hypothetical protein [Gemmatimonadota bacterium]
MKEQVLRHPTFTAISAALLVMMVGACTEAPDDAGQEGEAARGPSVLITVGNDRQVEVNGKVFGNGQHEGKPASGAPPGRTLVLLGQPGQMMTPVSIRSAAGDSLVIVHVDASTPDSATILLYGAYGSEMASMNQQEASESRTQAAGFGALNAGAAVRGWECIWCRGEILACGVEPQCGSGGAGGDFID